MQNKQVLHVIDHMGVGGAQVLLSELIKDKQVQLISLRKNTKSVLALDTSKHHCLHCNNVYSLLPYFKMWHFVNANHFSILHAHLFRSQFFSFLLKIRNRKITLLFHHHGSLLDRKMLHMLFLKISKKFVDHHIVVSDELANELSKIGIPKNKITVLHNFFAKKDFFGHYNKPLKNRIPQIGFVGRLSRVKGVDLLLSAMHSMPFQTHLICVGSGPEKKKLVKLSQKYHLSVDWVGTVTKNLSLYYNKMDVVVVPSYRESFSLVALEALWHGVPVVLPNEKALIALYSKFDTVVFFEKNNVKSLVQAVKKGLSKKSNVVKNRNIILKDFSLEAYIKKLTDIYNYEN